SPAIPISLFVREPVRASCSPPPVPYAPPPVPGTPPTPYVVPAGAGTAEATGATPPPLVFWLQIGRVPLPPRPPSPPRALPPLPPAALASPVVLPKPPTLKPRPPLPPTERPASPAAPPRAPAGHAVVCAELVPANR